MVLTLTQMTVFFCPGLVWLTCFFPSLFVRLLGFSLPIFRAVCHRWKYVWVVDLSLQGGSNVTVEDVAVFGECCSLGRDSSLNLLGLVFVSGVIYLSQVDVAFNVLYLSGVDIYWYVVSIITFVFDFRPWFSHSSASYCSISCSSCGVFAHTSTSSTKILHIAS